MSEHIKDIALVAWAVSAILTMLFVMSWDWISLSFSSIWTGWEGCFMVISAIPS